MSIEAITGRKILVTGVTGWVAGPLAESLASAGNTVYGAARFNEPAQRQPWHDKGVQTVSIDLENGRLDEVPADLDLVLHFAVAKSNNFAEAFAANAHGSADLMEMAAQRSDNLTFSIVRRLRCMSPSTGYLVERLTCWVIVIAQCQVCRHTASPRSLVRFWCSTPQNVWAFRQ